MRIEQVTPDQRDEVVAFLRKIFQAAEDAPFLAPQLTDWKYFEERPEWKGTRSYVLRVRGRIAAHGGIVPAMLLLPDGPVASVQIIDWAADKAFPGAGLILVRQLAELGDVNIGPGGSFQCVNVLTSLQSGHEVFARTSRLGRVIRPLLRLREGEPCGVRALARLAQDSLRAISLPRGSSSPWSAIAVNAFEDPLPPPAGTNGYFTPVIRSAAQLNYFLRCPAPKITGYLLSRNTEPGGHLLLAHARGVIRIADLQINSSIEEDWRDCFSLAVERATSMRPKAWRVRAMALPEMIRRAAAKAGLWECTQKEAFLQDPRAVLLGQPVPNLSMIDTDAAYFL